MLLYDVMWCGVVWCLIMMYESILDAEIRREVGQVMIGDFYFHIYTSVSESIMTESAMTGSDTGESTLRWKID